MKSNLFAVTAALILAGCAKTGVETAGVHAGDTPMQDKICEVHDWQANSTASCKPGQKIAFLPNSWGNDQLPILFAAVNCDMRYSVAMNNGGVVCIHAKMEVEPAKQAPNADAAVPKTGGTPK